MQVYRYLIQDLVQKQLAKKLIPISEMAQLYRDLTSPEHIRLVVDYLKYGAQPTVEVFDALLQYALEKLVVVYRVFLLYAPQGELLRATKVEVISEAFYTSALIIQTAWRRKASERLVGAAQQFRETRLQEAAEAEKRRQLLKKRRHVT